MLAVSAQRVMITILCLVNIVNVAGLLAIYLNKLVVKVCYQCYVKVHYQTGLTGVALSILSIRGKM